MEDQVSTAGRITDGAKNEREGKKGERTRRLTICP